MRTPSSPNTPVTLVGRERELGLLRDHLQAALAGHGSLVLIGGEAGIGKTALAETVCWEATEQGALVLIGRCYDLTETPPYGPWLELFARYRPGNNSPPLPDAFSQRGTVGPVASQRALIAQVLDFFASLTLHHPAIVFLDDLHWADPASLDLLRALAHSVADWPLLVLIAYRAEELTRRHPLYHLLPSLRREAAAQDLAARPLDDAAMGQLVQARYALPDANCERLVAFLQAKAEGNALFVGELLRSLEETDILRKGEGGYILGPLDQVAVPAPLQQVIDARVARLGMEALDLLGIAAVIGQEIPLDVWRAVAETDDDTLFDVSERAEEVRMLAGTSEGDRVRFVHALIRDALYQGIPATRRRRLHRRVGEVLAATRPPDPDMVAFQFQRAGDPRAVDWLVKAGGHAQRTHAYLSAADRYDAALALMGDDPTQGRQRGWLRYRIAMMRRVDDPRISLIRLDEAAAIATETADPVLAAHVLFASGLVRCNAGMVAEGLPRLEAGVTALQGLPHAALASLSELDFVQRHRGEGPLVFWLALAGRFHEARRQAEHFLAHTATDTSQGVDAYGYATVQHGLGIAYAFLGEPEAARCAFNIALAAVRTNDTGLGGVFLPRQLPFLVLPYHADDDAERQRVVGGWQALVERQHALHPLSARVAVAPIAFLEGRWDAVAEVANEVAIARLGRGAHDLPAVMTLASGERMIPLLDVAMQESTFGALAAARGEMEQAWSYVRRWAPHGPQTEPGIDRYPVCVAMQRLAVALALQSNDLAIAHVWLKSHDAWLAWSGAVLGQSERHALWAQYHRQAGDRKQAQGHAERALAHAMQPRQPLALLAAHRLLGELAIEDGQCDDAAAHLQTALALADACAAPYERALSLLAFAVLHLATEDHTAGAAMLDEVRAICEPLGARPTLTRADALAEGLMTGETPHDSYPGGLTAREAEVLRIVAAGLSNAEVAERLFLSPRTVGTHLTAIYTKLNVTSRGAAIRFALDHDLR